MSKFIEYDKKNNDPLFELPVPLKVSRGDNSLMLRMGIGEGEMGDYKFDMAWSNATFCIGVQKHDAKGSEGFKVYSVNMKPVIEAIIKSLPEFDEVAVLPHPKSEKKAG